MDPTLCGVVHGVIHQPGTHRVGTDVDDATMATRNHVRQYRTNTIDRRPQVVVDGGPQRLLGVLERWPDHAAAGIVDQNVDVAESLGRRRHHLVSHARLVELAGEGARDGRMLVHAFQIFLAAGSRENCRTIAD